MSDYYFDGELLKEYYANLCRLKEIMDNTYSEAERLMTDIENGEWSGNARDAMIAFLDLVTQFHGDFSGEDGNPINEAKNTFGELVNNLASFYTDYYEYLEMSKI